jgi:hypothetical protein
MSSHDKKIKRGKSKTGFALRLTKSEQPVLAPRFISLNVTAEKMGQGKPDFKSGSNTEYPCPAPRRDGCTFISWGKSGED